MFSGFASCLFSLIVLAAIGYPLWRIAERLGFPGPMSLLMYVPILNLVVLWYLALNPWPIDRGRVAVDPPVTPPQAFP
ncbi:MAG: hypothetical protein ABI682_07275 [Acidobacteriota bacterium]